MNKKLLTGGIALSLLLGGSALSAFAAADSGTQPTPSPSDKPSVEKKWQGKQGHHEGAAEKFGGAFLGKDLFSKAAAVIGITADDVKTGLKAGKSLADLAKERGVSADTLVAELAKQESDKIDKAVANGKLTEDKANTIKSKITDHIRKQVEQKGLPKFKRHAGEHKMMPLMHDTKKLAPLIGISVDDLNTQLKAGKSLAEIAQEHGVGKDQLISKLKEDLTPMLEKFVDHKRAEKKAESAE